MTKKDRKIISDARKRNIPIFVLIAKDKLAMETIKFYQNEAADHDLVDMYDSLEEKISEFEEWQAKNPEQVKLPD